MILKAKHKDLNKIVEIHLDVLVNTFSSRVGREFLFGLYKNLLDNPKSCRVAVFKKNGNVGGFISSSTHFGKLNKILKYSTYPKDLSRIAAYLLRNPTDLNSFLKRLKFNNYLSNNVFQPYILTLCVSKENQGRGVGSLLIKNTENYYKRKGETFLYVDTEEKNIRAIGFYKKTGFKPFKNHLGNKILRKKLHG